jgi:DNA-binding transcriptional regulator LsrR (DeoR family)
MENAWNNTLVQKAVKNMHGLDVVFGGIGGYGIPDDLKTRLTMEGFVQSIIAPEKLIEQGAAGDYSYCTYDHIGDGKKDRNGNDAWRFFITAGHDSKTPGIEFFKNMAATPGKKVVAIGGPYLTPAIKAALKGKICNVIILDEYSAKEIVAGS